MQHQKYSMIFAQETTKNTKKSDKENEDRVKFWGEIK